MDAIKQRLLCLIGRHDSIELGSIGLVTYGRHRLHIHACKRCGQFGTSGGDLVGAVWRSTRTWRGRWTDDAGE